MKTKHKSGFSLIEIMVAALLLAFLALGGAATLYHTGAGIQVQGNKRIAIELANDVLERERTKGFMGILAPSPGEVPREEDSVEVVDGIQHGIHVEWSQHGTTIANLYKKIEVKVTYRSGVEPVRLDTMVSFEN